MDNNKKINNVNNDKTFSDAVSHEKKRLRTVNKKGFVIGITALSVATALGALTTGHFIYKNIKANTLEERVEIDPAVAKDAKISELKYDEGGNASCLIVLKDPENKMIDTDKTSVYIGKDELKQGEEYTFQTGNDSETDSKIKVVIKKQALENHSGKIIVNPGIKDISFDVVFKADPVGVENPHEFANEVKAQDVKKGETASEPYAKAKTGETSISWYYFDENGNKKPFAFTTRITQTYTLYPEWQMLKTYNISLYSDNQVIEQAVPVGKTISKPDVTKEGYHLVLGNVGSGWYSGKDADEKEWDFTTKLEKDTDVPVNGKLTAKWAINEYTVTFDANGGTIGGEAKKVQSGIQWNTSITAPTDEMKKEGCTFDGWLLNGASYNFGSPVTKDMTLVANWKKAEVNLTLTQTTGGNAERLSPAGDKIYYGDEIKLKATPNAGYTFSKWVNENDIEISKMAEYNFVAKSDVTLKPVFTEDTYTITYNNLYTSTAPTKKSYTYADVKTTSITLANPTNIPAGLTFEGWFTEEEGGTEVTQIAQGSHENFILYAHWGVTTVDITTASNNTDYGTVSESKTGVVYSTLTTVTATPKDGCKFLGWKKNSESSYIPGAGASYSFSATETVKLTAYFEQTTYKVQLDAAGGTITGSTSYDKKYNETIDTAPTVSRDGFTLDGWYYNDKGSITKFIFGDSSTGTKIQSDMTLTAHWTKNETFSVTFNTNGGSGDAPETTIVEKNGRIASAPSYSGTKAGYTLVQNEWYTDAGCAAETKFNFGATTGTQVTSDLVLYAKWTENTPSAITSLALASGTTSIKQGEHDQAVATLGDTYAGSIKYSIDDINKATINEDTGYITGVAAGNVTITATYYKKDGTEPSPTVTKTLLITVTAPATSHIVSFNSNGGDAFVPAVSVTDGGRIASEPSAGSKTGFTFEGWHIGSATGTKFEFGDTGTQVTSDITLVANWTDDDPVTSAVLNISGTVSQGQTVQGTVVFKDKDGNPVTTPTGTILWAITRTTEDATATIDQNGLLTGGTGNGMVDVTVTYTTASGTVITSNTCNVGIYNN